MNMYLRPFVASFRGRHNWWVSLVVIFVSYLLITPVLADQAIEDLESVTGVLDDEVVTIEEATENNQSEIQLTGAEGDFSDTYAKEQLAVSGNHTDFVVGPGRFELELAPGQARTVELVITNRMGERKLFSLDTEDAGGSATGVEAISLLGDQIGPYTIKDYISVPHEKFYLNNGERARVPVTISIPADAEPGGRYGSILTSVTSNPNELGVAGGAQPASAVISRIGTLFFVTTPGVQNQENILKDFSTLNNKWLFTEGPITFNILHENSGTVHANPYGRITITNILGEEVGTTIIEPWFVMPQSLRTREVRWNRDFLIGRYTATAEINRGYDDIIDTASYSFWVIPWKLVLGVFVGFLLFFLILRTIFSRFEIKRKT